jgi:long-chain fatty acid transport protein
MARGKTYNATPSFAYQLNNWLSIGAGVQIERARADFSSGLPVNNAGNPALALGNQFNIYGYGWGFGFTASVTLTPPPTTTIGLGYRSAINQKINGTLTLPPGGSSLRARDRHPARSTPRSTCPTSSRSAFASASIRN